MALASTLDDPRLPAEIFPGYMRRRGFTRPTPVQARCWVPLLSGKSMLAVAQTGSGKTLAYLLPAVPHIQRHQRMHGDAADGAGPVALVLVPTRELARQVQAACAPLRRLFGLTCVCVYGGADRQAQAAALDGTVHLAVATPGRLVDLAGLVAEKPDGDGTDAPTPAPQQQQREPGRYLRRVSYFVLDEADRMLKMGLREQITAIHGAVSAATASSAAPQLLLFSATFPAALREAASRWFGSRDAEVVHVTGAGSGGSDGAAVLTLFNSENGDMMDDDDANAAAAAPVSVSSAIEQVVQVCASHKKPKKLIKFLLKLRGRTQDKGDKGASMSAVSPSAPRQRHLCLVFCNKIKTVRFLADFLRKNQFRCGTIHGQMRQEDRDNALREFRAGKVPLLLASDVAGRGLHIRNLSYVVNYDFPSNLETYVHRIGRVGREGSNASGHAFSFFTRNLAPLARPLIAILNKSKGKVDPNLAALVVDADDEDDEDDEAGDEVDESWKCVNLCGFAGTYEAVEAHEATCGESVAVCTKGCGFQGTQGEVERHCFACTYVGAAACVAKTPPSSLSAAQATEETTAAALVVTVSEEEGEAGNKGEDAKEKAQAECAAKEASGGKTKKEQQQKKQSKKRRRACKWGSACPDPRGCVFTHPGEPDHEEDAVCTPTSMVGATSNKSLKTGKKKRKLKRSRGKRAGKKHGKAASNKKARIMSRGGEQTAASTGGDGNNRNSTTKSTSSGGRTMASASTTKKVVVNVQARWAEKRRACVAQQKTI